MDKQLQELDHQPDFIWIKQRGDAGYDHSLHNSVSGVLLKQLISNSTDAEITNTRYNNIK
jgi:hypothetical protein